MSSQTSGLSARRVLDSDEFADAVRAQERHFQQAGIQSGRAKGIMMCWPCHIAKMSGRSGRTWS